MTEEPFGRNDCSKEMKLARVTSATPSVLKSRPRVTLPEAAILRAFIARTSVAPPPVPTVYPLLPKLDPVALKLMTGAGGPVGLAPPTAGALAPLISTSKSVALRITPGTPTSATPLLTPAALLEMALRA